MISKNINNLTFLQFHNFLKEKSIIHFSSTRLGGFSKNHLANLNLGYTVGDDPEIVEKNIELLSDATGIPYKNIIFPKQTNGVNIKIVETIHDDFPDTDALITNINDICIGVKTADCVPVLLFDTEKKVIAAVHSGWKGTVEKISKKTIELMTNKFGTNPEKIIAGIGPSIGPLVYEIGPDVIELVKHSFNENHVLEFIQSGEKALFNLWEANKIILTECGVLLENIEIASMCTYSNQALFYSARRDKNKTGRLATGIMMI